MAAVSHTHSHTRSPARTPEHTAAETNAHAHEHGQRRKSTQYPFGTPPFSESYERAQEALRQREEEAREAAARQHRITHVILVPTHTHTTHTRPQRDGARAPLLPAAPAGLTAEKGVETDPMVEMRNALMLDVFNVSAEALDLALQLPGTELQPVMRRTTAAGPKPGGAVARLEVEQEVERPQAPKSSLETSIDASIAPDRPVDLWNPDAVGGRGPAELGIGPACEPATRERMTSSQPATDSAQRSIDRVPPKIDSPKHVTRGQDGQISAGAGWKPAVPAPVLGTGPPSHGEASARSPRSTERVTTRLCVDIFPSEAATINVTPRRTQARFDKESGPSRRAVVSEGAAAPPPATAAALSTGSSATLSAPHNVPDGVSTGERSAGSAFDVRPEMRPSREQAGMAAVPDRKAALDTSTAKAVEHDSAPRRCGSTASSECEPLLPAATDAEAHARPAGASRSIEPQTSASLLSLPLSTDLGTGQAPTTINQSKLLAPHDQESAIQQLGDALQQLRESLAVVSSQLVATNAASTSSSRIHDIAPPLLSARLLHPEASDAARFGGHLPAHAMAPVVITGASCDSPTLESSARREENTSPGPTPSKPSPVTQRSSKSSQPPGASIVYSARRMDASVLSPHLRGCSAVNKPHGHHSAWQAESPSTAGGRTALDDALARLQRVLASSPVKQQPAAASAVGIHADTFGSNGHVALASNYLVSASLNRTASPPKRSPRQRIRSASASPMRLPRTAVPAVPSSPTARELDAVAERAFADAYAALHNLVMLGVEHSKPGK